MHEVVRLLTVRNWPLAATQNGLLGRIDWLLLEKADVQPGQRAANRLKSANRQHWAKLSAADPKPKLVATEIFI